MNSTVYAVSEVTVATTATTATALAISAEPLLTALIALGVSLVSVVGGELVKLLVAYLQKKTNDLKKEDKDGNGNG